MIGKLGDLHKYQASRKIQDGKILCTLDTQLGAIGCP